MISPSSGKRARRARWSTQHLVRRRARAVSRSLRRLDNGNPPVCHAGDAGSIPARRSELLSRVLSCDPEKLMRLAPSVRDRLLAHAYAQAGYRSKN